MLVARDMRDRQGLKQRRAQDGQGFVLGRFKVPALKSIRAWAGLAPKFGEAKARAWRYQPLFHRAGWSAGMRPSGKVFEVIGRVVGAGGGNAQTRNPVAHLAQAQAKPAGGGCTVKT